MKKTLSLITILALSLLVIGCGSGESEIDKSVPVKTMADVKPGEPTPTGVGAPGGAPAGGAPAAGGPAAPSSE